MNQTACSAGAGAVTGFEGPEKRLEIDFTFNNNDELLCPLSHMKSKMGFRAISLDRWQEMCTLAKCTIMHSTHNDHFDSYVLSESSLFVYPTKVMIKTCGTTTLLNAIPKILEYARELDLSLSLVMYSRKNFIFPKEQLFPHRGWDSEVEFLDTFFDGNSYVLGSMNTDHWCLYLADYSNSSTMEMNNAISSVAQDIVMNLSNMQQNSDDECERALSTPPMSPSMSCSDLSSVSNSPLMISPCSSPMLSSSPRSASFDDFFFDGSREEVIVDIMMQDLDRTVAKTFYRSPETGDFDKYPGMAELLGQTAVTDEFNFTPCGYSMNGLLNEAYYTIHITPEPHCSYASFETNVNFSGQQDAYHGLIKRVLSLFKPGRVTLAFSSSIINSNNHPTSSSTTKHTALRTEFPGYITRYKTVTQALEGNTRQVTMCNLESADYFAANQQTLAAAKAMKRSKLVSSSSATPIAL